MSQVNQIEVSADFQDITITIGDYSDADARQAISVVDAGGDGSLTYTTSTGVITYTGPSAAEVRSHFSAGTGISLVNGVISNTAPDTNTTYTQNASSVAGGANLNLVGSDATTDSVKFAGSGATTVTQTDASTITISSTDTNTTYSQNVTATSGGANLNLAGSDASTDTVKFAAGAGITVAETDASTITVTSTITQYTDAMARGAISVNDTGGDGSLSYDTPTGVITYAGPTNANYRGAVSAANTGTGHGSLGYDAPTGVFTYTKVTDANIRGAISVTDAGGDGSLAYDNGTGVITYNGPTSADYRAAISVTESGTGYGGIAYDTGTGVITYTGVTGSDIRTEVQDGRNLTYSTNVLNLDTALADVNSVTAQTATDLTLTGDQLVLKTRDVGGVADTFLTLDSAGYNFQRTGTISIGTDIGSSTDGFIQSAGTTSELFYAYSITGASTAGSNVLTGCKVFNPWDFLTLTPLTWSSVTSFIAGKPLLQSGNLQLGVKIDTITIDPVDPTLATITLTVGDTATSANATTTNANFFAIAAHYMRNSDASNVCSISNNIGNVVTAGSPVVAGTIAGTGTKAYQPVAYWSHNYTVAPTGFFTGRKILQFKSETPINQHVSFPFGLGVGPGAISTNRGVPRDAIDAIGINLYNPGTLRGYTGKTIFNLTQFTDNSYYSGIPDGGLAERSGGQFSFNHLRGNANTLATGSSNFFGRNGDGVGRIIFWAQSGASGTNLASSDVGVANIHSKVTQDLNVQGVTGGGGLYLQHTPNTAGVASARTFLSAEDQQVELKAINRVQLKPMVRNITVPTSSGSFDNATKRLTLNFTTTYQYAPYGNQQRVALTGFDTIYNTTFNPNGTPTSSTLLWTVVSCTTSSVVLEIYPTSPNYNTITTAPTTYGSIVMSFSARGDGTAYGLSAQHPHVWLEASDYTPGSVLWNGGTEGTGTLVKIAADYNNGDVGLMLRRTVNNTANFEFKLPTASSNTLQLVNNGNSSTVFSVNNDAITFTETVRNTTTTATTAVGTTYTPAATVSNYVELELTAGSGTTTINVDNLTQAGSGAHYAILVYNNSGGNIGNNDLQVTSNGTAISQHTGLNNGQRAIFTVYCVGAYASCEYMTAA